MNFQFALAENISIQQLNQQAGAALSKAENSFKKAIALSNNFGLAIYNLGIVYERQGKVNEAIVQLEALEWIQLQHLVDQRHVELWARGHLDHGFIETVHDLKLSMPRLRGKSFRRPRVRGPCVPASSRHPMAIFVPDSKPWAAGAAGARQLRSQSSIRTPGKR